MHIRWRIGALIGGSGAYVTVGCALEFEPSIVSNESIVARLFSRPG
jgi:hypothetical protein